MSQNPDPRDEEASPNKESDASSSNDNDDHDAVSPTHDEKQTKDASLTPVVAKAVTAGIPLPPYMAPPNISPVNLIAAMQQQHAWNAPVPPPEAAERFEKLCPGSFERMLRMAEKEQDNQIDVSQKQIAIAKNISDQQIVLATRAQDFLARDTKRGHWLGAMISILAMIGSITSEVYQQTAIGVAFLGVPLTTVVIAFINSHKESKQVTEVKPKEIPDNSSNKEEQKD